MKTLCIYVTKDESTQATMMVDTKYKLTPASKFMELLEELHEISTDIISLEIYSTQQTTYFCYTADGPTIDVFAGLVYAMLGKAEIREIPDFTFFADENSMVGVAEIGLRRDDIFPILTYQDTQADTLAPMLSVIARIPPEFRVMVQVVGRPYRDSAALHFDLFFRRGLDRLKHLFRVKYWFKSGFRQQFVEKTQEKCARKIYGVNMRFAVVAPNVPKAEQAQMKRAIRGHLDSILGGYGILSSLDLNELRFRYYRFGLAALRPFQARRLAGAFRASAHEVSSLWHLPTLQNIPNAAQVLSAKAPPPAALPRDLANKDLCFFGKTNYRDRHTPFGILREDRRRHMYILGRAGSGKSRLLELLIKADMEAGHGLALLDPHGDVVDALLKLVPRNRVKDVVVFDPTDTEFPVSFNPLEQVSPAMRMRVAVGFVEMAKRRFRAEWSDRLEHLLRYTVLALLSTPGTTVLSIRRMLVDPNYRKVIVHNIRDQVVRAFWEREYDTWAKKYHDAAIAPLINKIGEFTSTSMVRNIIGQPFNKLNFREIMDTGKIVLLKVPKGVLGDDASSLLGAMLVSKLYQAAMSRADIPLRARRDFYFYIDEFHNFADGSFDEILAEARKYRLNLTMANQFLGQLPDEVRRTIFGNIGALIAFRLSGEDGPLVASEMHPRFSPSDLTNLGIRDFAIKMAVDGVTQECFSGTTMDLEIPDQNYAQDCIQRSRQAYALPLNKAVELLKKWEEAA